MSADDPAAPADDAADDAAALRAGPWTAEAMAIRLTHRRGALLVPPAVSALVAAVLARFPAPPPADGPLAEVVAGLLAGPLASVAGPRVGVPDLAALCRLLDLDAAELAWFADRQHRGRRAPQRLQHYHWRALPRRGGGVRLVAAPKPRLKEIQRRLLRHVCAPIRLHDAAHGCVPGRSVRTAVEPHVGAHVLIRLDLEAFFPTLSAGRVRGVLRALHHPEPVAAAIAALCTAAAPVAVVAALPGGADPAYRTRQLLRAPHLPQGAPTSPALANALGYGLDRRLAALAGRFGARYTRYVDDLLISGGRSLPVERLLDAAVAVIRDEGFRPAGRKTAVLTRAGRLGALGAVLNERVSLPRPERDRLRATVHNCVVHGGPSQARDRPDFAAELLGRIAALGALDPRLARRLRADYERIDWG